MSSTLDFGALVISLDFELHWGMRDHESADVSRARLMSSRGAIPRMLELFEEFSVSATWATVGFLFARSREDLRGYRPAVPPRYTDRTLDPYGEQVGHGEEDDPIHFAASIVEVIQAHPGQEIATHTFSHYYCLEPTPSAEAFEADLRSAVAIAARAGVTLRSIVFPRNQFNPDYADILLSMGIECYRGTPRRWMYRASPKSHRSPSRRAARLLDAYAGRSAHLTPWRDVPQPSGLFDVAASLFLRPSPDRFRRLETLRRERIVHSLRAAAIRREIFHLWWHPHNFGVRTDDNLAFLRAILEEFAVHRERGTMRSLSMAGVVDELRGFR